MFDGPVHGKFPRALFRQETTDEDQQRPVCAAALVLEPLTYSQAQALGHGLLEHCFTDEHAIRGEFTQVQVKPHEREQAMTLRMALDTEAHCVLRQVRLDMLTVSKRGPVDGPATLRLTMGLLLDPDRIARDFFGQHVGTFWYVTFEPEQLDLFSSEALVEDDKERAGLVPATGR